MGGMVIHWSTERHPGLDLLSKAEGPVKAPQDCRKSHASLGLHQEKQSIIMSIKLHRMDNQPTAGSWLQVLHSSEAL